MRTKEAILDKKGAYVIQRLRLLLGCLFPFIFDLYSLISVNSSPVLLPFHRSRRITDPFLFHPSLV